MAGTISTLGVGSGLELQNIIDQLRELDEQRVVSKQTEVARYEAQLVEFSVVKDKLLDMKSAALDLSLESTFLGRTASSSDEDVAEVTVSDGATVQSLSIDVNRLAEKSTWMSTDGFSSSDAIVYVPTSQDSSGLADPNTSIASGAGQLVITFGGSQTITIDVDASTVMDNGNPLDDTDLVGLINTDAENAGLVTASTYVSGSETYLRIETATVGGTGEDHRVEITTNGTDLTFAPQESVFMYTVGDDATSINVAADTTLEELINQINSDTNNPGLTASMINDGLDPDNPYKLVLTADDTGEDNRITITSQLPDAALAENADQAAAGSLNAEFEVDNVLYQRQSNSVTDIISGLTIDLKSTGTTSVAVKSDDDGLKEKISALVEAYNDVVQEVRSNTGYNSESEQFGILANTTMRDLPYDLQGLMTSSIYADSERKITSLFNLGLEFDRQGQITINDETLSQVLTDNIENLKSFFLGDSDNDIEGFADKVNERLRTLTSTTGIVEGEKTAAQQRIDSIELSIENETSRIEKKYEILTRQFIELDQFMSQMTSMSSYLASQFDSLGGLWGAGGGSSSN